MNIYIGYVSNIKNNKIFVIFAYHYYAFKYKKIQIKMKKCTLLSYKNEYFLGDFILLNVKHNKIYNLF